jgi:hypothetical protein
MRWLWALPSVLFGALVGTAALTVHRQAVWMDAWPIPWGAVLAVAAPTAVGIIVRRRTPVLVGFLLGWLLTVLGTLGGGPGGDFLLMSDVIGWGFLGVSVLLIGVLLALGGAARRHPARDTTAT